MDRIELTDAQQTAVFALFQQREQILSEANRALQRLADAIADLAALYAARAGADGDGDWEFAQDAPGQPVYLRRRAPGEAQRSGDAER